MRKKLAPKYFVGLVVIMTAVLLLTIGFGIASAKGSMGDRDQDRLRDGSCNDCIVAASPDQDRLRLRDGSCIQ